ncbi:MAG TPA: TlpA disulfide reductase family protein, partial [Acidimicrobiales bacterium]|nr:TlpA disulfide reductase family protein [Acidimicrobiales bacterium]
TTLASFREEYVVVNFFASWCPPCQLEEPQLVQFAAEHGSGAKAGAVRAAIVGVVFGDSASNARSFDVSNRAGWPAVVDPGSAIALSYGVESPPETFVIAPGGRVVAKLDGSVTAAALDSVIDGGTGAES